MAHHGDNGLVVKYSLEFFVWLGQGIILIKYFWYEGMDYKDDPDINPPAGHSRVT